MPGLSFIIILHMTVIFLMKYVVKPTSQKNANREVFYWRVCRHRDNSFPQCRLQKVVEDREW